MKAISTEHTAANVARVLDLLGETPTALLRFSQSRPEAALHAPLAPGERSFVETLAHLINCEEITTASIYAALMLHEPLILPLHPERHWGAVLAYETMPVADLLGYFAFRRTALLRVLNGLTETQWARTIREEGKQRRESVYWRARTLALHELEHLADLARKGNISAGQ